jgi:CRP/FNR family transcriptional regulator
MDYPSYTKYLAEHFTAWEHMSDGEREALLDHTVLKSYEKGTNLHGGDSDCVGFFLILSGVLRTYMLSEEGRDITLYRLGRGDMCILSASCVLSTITFEVNVDAEEDTELLLIGAPYFSALSEKNIYVECFAYKIATERFSDVMWAMQQILFMSMDKRLAVFLWDELSKAEGDTIHITHEQAARYIGSAREVVTRMLKYFASDGIVELSRGGIKIINRQKLRALTK